MGHQIIKCPDGTLAIFSDGVGTWIVSNATAEEIGDYYAERAAKNARESALDTCAKVLSGNARKVYYEFTMTYEEACAEAGGTPAETD